MRKRSPGRFGKFSVLAVLVGLLLGACKGQVQPSAASFVGKWQSSKLTTPLHLYDNGEWEIKNDNGGVLQYGLWAYQDSRIIWHFKSAGQIGREVNPVESVNASEFRLREGGQITVFKRLD